MSITHMAVGNFIDQLGTALRLPEFGLSEALNQGARTSYTGITPQSQSAGFSYNPANPTSITGAKATPQVNYSPLWNGSNKPIQSKVDILGEASYRPPSNNGRSGAMTPQQALDAGKDANELRRQGLLIESGPSQSDIAAQQNKARDTINQGFQGIFSQLDSIAGLAPQYEQEDTKFVNDQYGVEAQARQNELVANQQKLGTYRTDAGNREKTTLSAIAQDMRNMLKAGNSKIGAMGAADSSAVPMYNYALSKQTGQRTADVRNQTNTQYGELDRKEIDVKSAFDTAMSSLGSWKNEQLLAAKDRARTLLERVQGLKTNASQSRLTALVGLEQGILTDVTNTVRQVEAEERQNAKAIQNWATQRIASLQDYKLNLQKSADFSPQAMTYDALQGINYTGAPTDTTMYNPMALQKKKADPWA